MFTFTIQKHTNMTRLFISCSIFFAGILFAQDNLKMDKSGKPLTGTIVADGTSTIFKNGKIMEKIFKDDYSDRQLVIEKYENDVLISVEYFDFSIESKPQKSYKGIYNSGKKYQGYFRGEAIIDEFKIIDYYENGELKFQYFFDYLKQGDNLGSFNYDIKIEYKDGKILNGYSYQLLGSAGVLRTEYRGGRAVSFDWDVFAMHYFNRITVSQNNDQLLIKQLENQDTFKVVERNNKLLIEKLDSNKTSIGTSWIGSATNLENAVIVYYINGNELKSLKIGNPNLYSDSDIISNILLNLIYAYDGNKVEGLLKFLIDKFQNDFNSFSSNSGQGFPFADEDIVSNLRYDSKGSPLIGIKLNKVTNGFDYEVYEEGIKKQSGLVKSVGDIKIKIAELMDGFKDK